MTNLQQKAFVFAQVKHKGQKDDDGKDYFEAHCLIVYRILQDINASENLLCAALLHDTIEDTDTTYEELVKEFTKDIADLVMEVTHDGKKDEIGYYFPRLKSQRGIMLKFADRLSNISRMDSWVEERRQHYLQKSRFWQDENNN